jgi:hypothetical protein
MGNRLLWRLALEDMCAAADESQPQSLSIPQTLTELQEAENASTENADNIARTQDSVMAMESLARSLKRPEALKMGKMGGMYLNLAAEQLMEQARLPERVLPMDVSTLEQAPEQTVEGAMGQMVNSINAAADVTRMDLTDLMVTLTLRREGMTKLIQELHHRLDEIKEDLELCKTNGHDCNASSPSCSSQPLGPPERYRLINYSGQGIVAYGSSVSSDVLHLLEDHMAMYKRLVHEQSEYIRQHKDNNLTWEGGWDQYYFDPALYLMAGVQFSHAAPDGQIFVSKDLPGGLKFYCKTIENKRFGGMGLDALAQSGAWIAPDPQYQPRPPAVNDTVFALSLLDIEAREKEARMALLKLREWSDFVNRDLWSQALFEEALTTIMISAIPGDPTQQRAYSFMRSVAAVCIKLCSEASGNLGSELLAVMACLVQYLEDSIRCHVPKHVDGAAS